MRTRLAAIFLLSCSVVWAVLGVGAVYAGPSILQTEKIADGVYALIGPTGQRAPDNVGNNANFGVIVTQAGVVLIDSGGSAKGAEMIERAVRGVTELPIVAVINTGGQDHRWLGNGYFKQRGARLIASVDAVADQRARSVDQLFVLENLLGAQHLAGTEPAYADETFADNLELNIGGVRIYIEHAPAHTPGDSFVWLADAGVMFSGDIVYVDRMAGVIPVSNTAKWLASFDAMAAHTPSVIVPGHGRPASLEKARGQTRDYIAHLRARVGDVLAAGGDINQGVQVDQSAFAHLANFDSLSGRNAQQVFMEMEFE